MTLRTLTAAALTLVFLFGLPVVVFATPTTGFTEAPNFAGTAGGNDLVNKVETVVNALLVFASVIAAIFLIIGGIQYVTSAGDEDKAATAKNTILYSIIGIIVIILSAVIANFIIALF